MDISNVAGTASQGVEQAHGRHHRHMGMAERLDKMSSAIDQAVQNGNLTGDQATQMKSQLEDIKTVLENAKTSGTPITGSERKEINQELHDIQKQLFSAINPAKGKNTAAPDAVAELFKKIDANSDGSIDKNELTDFVNQLKNNYSKPANAQGTYTQQASFSFSMSYQSTISYSA